MKECHIAVKPTKSSKQQALEAIGKLGESLPIERAQMRIRISAPVRAANKLKKLLSKLAVIVESDEVEGEDTSTLVILMDPGQYRHVEELVKSETQGVGSLELLNLKEVRDDEEKLK